MDPIRERIERLTRRHFFGRTGLSLGTAALSTLMAEAARSDTKPLPAALPPQPRRPAACPGCRTFLPRPSEPSICT